MAIEMVIASKNPDKAKEIAAVMAEVGLIPIWGQDWPDVQETGVDLEANALLKAEAVMAATGLPTLADDTGLEVAAIGGAPGVRTARFAGPDATYDDNVSLLLERMAGIDDRRATFRTVVAAVFPGGRRVLAEGALEGTIALVRRGSGGFGYDPVFEVEGSTLAELGVAVKNTLSHRARAVRALAAKLSE
ncbi:MAG TPA: RdgB/HAM1 family non-canonical purine NTP pyrophosphatase [Acidimicrobiia bacterium]